MSIGKRIEEAVEKMQRGDAEAALIPTSIALDATAKKEYPQIRRNDVAYKQFIRENFGFITKVAFRGTTIGALHVKFDHQDVRPGRDGTCSIEQILYHVVRCGLIHDGQIPKNLRFVKEDVIKCEGGKSLTLPAGLVYGLIAAVVVAGSNASERVRDDLVFNFRGRAAPVNEVWGQKEKLLDVLARALK